jgi:hypothetical protein
MGRASAASVDRPKAMIAGLPGTAVDRYAQDRDAESTPGKHSPVVFNRRTR